MKYSRPFLGWLSKPDYMKEFFIEALNKFFQYLQISGSNGFLNKHKTWFTEHFNYCSFLPVNRITFTFN